ncbi:uncharacterized protein K02A2.6-like [Sabethes cyaneus]|uniref:uncharacterized protein K02A2.6-like n=1 Tax=Sabethes cyaneus TaxID=53552 RepID=UPI00237D7B7A|nr:uncharacterized protein K02A2.6-like [Sabethes cyaneus]
MDEAVVRVVDSCTGCRLVSQPELPEPMQRRKLPDAPWVDVAIDFLGPLPSGDYLLVIVDYFSRYKEVEVLRKITASETAIRLENIFVRLGYPRTITLDNGRQFVSREFEEYCRTRGIVLNRTTPYWPQENGLVERQNRSLIKQLKISQALKDWKQDLLTYLSIYYSTPQSTTGKTQTELMYGRNIRTKLPSLQDISTAVPCNDFTDRDQQAKERGKEREDDRRKAKPSSIVIGYKVLVKNLLPGNKLTPTFNPTTMTVTAKEGSRVVVQDDNGRAYQRNSSHLKKLGLDPNSTVNNEDPNAFSSVEDHHDIAKARNNPKNEQQPRLSHPKMDQLKTVVDGETMEKLKGYIRGALRALVFLTARGSKRASSPDEDLSAPEIIASPFIKWIKVA